MVGGGTGRVGRGGGGGGTLEPVGCKNACPSGPTTTTVPGAVDTAGGGGTGLLGVGGDVPLFVVRWDFIQSSERKYLS